MLEAAARADQLLEDGDMAGAATWHRILNVIERLQTKAPEEGEVYQIEASLSQLATQLRVQGAQLCVTFAL